MQAHWAFCLGLALFLPVVASAAGRLGPPTLTSAGSYGGVAYNQYNGLFEGGTSTGGYRVPYQIVAPADPRRGNHVALVEPPHFQAALGSLELFLGRDFLFTRGFTHGGVGYSTANLDGGTFRILDPTVSGVFVNGGVEEGGGRTDDEIVIDFARALVEDSGGRSLVGRLRHRYVTGFSDSAACVERLLGSGLASGVFQFAMPWTADDSRTVSPEPAEAIATGLYDGKVIVSNSEGGEFFEGLVDDGSAPQAYRFYAVAGAAHVADPLLPFPLSNTSSPASHHFASRAHFLQGDRWVRFGIAPPPSNHLLTSDTDPSDGTDLERDANGNSISVDAAGHRVPRLPFVELGEARYRGSGQPDCVDCGFIGTYDRVKMIAELGFGRHRDYVAAFGWKLLAHLLAGQITFEDAQVMLRRAALCPPLTYTEVYRDHYDDFVAVTPCD